MDYIHFNPVRHGLAHHPSEWPFSSFCRCVKDGVYPADWTVTDVALADAGERL